MWFLKFTLELKRPECLYSFQWASSRQGSRIMSFYCSTFTAANSCEVDHIVHILHILSHIMYSLHLVLFNLFLKVVFYIIYQPHDKGPSCTIASKINVTSNGDYLPISKLHSILTGANLLAHNNISQICYYDQISFQSATVNSSFTDNLTTLGYHLFCWWWYCKKGIYIYIYMVKFGYC